MKSIININIIINNNIIIIIYISTKKYEIWNTKYQWKIFLSFKYLVENQKEKK